MDTLTVPSSIICPKAIGNIVNNAVITVCGARWVPDLRSDNYITYMCLITMLYTRN